MQRWQRVHSVMVVRRGDFSPERAADLRTSRKNGFVVLDEHGDAFGKLLQEYGPWDWWSTWTFAKPYSAESAARCFEAFMKALGEDVSYLYVIEANRFREGTHVHAVVGNVSRLRRDDTWGKWFKRYGRCHVVPYDNREQDGCGQYLSKYLTKGACWWNIKAHPQGGLSLRHRPRLHRAERASTSPLQQSAVDRSMADGADAVLCRSVRLLTTSKLSGKSHAKEMDESEWKKALWFRKGGRPVAGSLKGSDIALSYTSTNVQEKSCAELPFA